MARAARSTPVDPPCSPCCPNNPDAHPPPAGDRSRVSSWLTWWNELSLRFFLNGTPRSLPSSLPRLFSSCANAVRSTSNIFRWLEMYCALSARGIDAISRGSRFPLAERSCACASWLLSVDVIDPTAELMVENQSLPGAWLFAPPPPAAAGMLNRERND